MTSHGLRVASRPLGVTGSWKASGVDCAALAAAGASIPDVGSGEPIVESEDKMTDHQIAAKVREYYQT